MSITPESVQALLHSEDFGDRLRGVNQLRQLEPATAFELIQTAVADSSARVRYAAVSQLSSLGHHDLAQTATILRDRLHNDPEPDVQAAAADSLGALKLQDALEDLQQLYQQTPEWLVQFSIIAALGELGDPRGFELLETALTSENELVEMAAIGSLGELGDRRAIPLLVSYASHPDWQVRHRLVQALGRLGGAEAQSALTTLAQDQVPQVAQEAQETLQSV
ncbi:HEAT repeat domain-containing protein [Trichocoleus sp. FACHB-591]|nr:HEAT repeat domain-containing protein [Trichocoleus sp. FACHB-591]MBD2094636.1 HEAT repeat domain-containing protein [Trichocoleus sp. FACHB-591]